MRPTAEPSRLADRRLYLVADASFAGVEAALAGGVDVLQLRDRRLPDGRLLATARRWRELAHRHGALFFVNDRPDLALLAGADGVHVGQNDLPPSEVRRLAGDRLLVGQSTHAPEQLAAASGVDYVAVGPVHETPTKPGRPAAGLAYVRHAAAHAAVPWFAIGGLDAETAPAAVEAGARRIVVVRAITQAADPAAAAARLRSLLP